MDLFTLIPNLISSENAIQFLRDRGILRSQPPSCPLATCQREMTEVSKGRRRRSGGDDKMWRCPTHKNKTLSIRKGSFLENSNLLPQKFVLFSYLWAHGVPSACQEALCDIGRPHVVNWNNYMRDICSQHLLANPIELGGPGQIVQIDESLMSKRKQNVGHVVEERWVFGIFDVQKRIGILEFIPDKRQATLFAIIRKYVRGGSIIHSDSAAMYVNVRRQESHIVKIPTIPMPPYRHVWVNHKRNFVDPATGACTNLVESFWKNAKQKNKQMSGTTAELLPTYLDEFQWRQLYGKKTSEAFDSILAQIAHYYPVNN